MLSSTRAFLAASMLFLALAVAPLVTPAAAVPAGTGPASAGPLRAGTEQAASSTVPVMIVLDASGSMAAVDAPGSRIDAAKTAVVQLVHSLPRTSLVGLIVYGTGTGSGDDEKAAGCQDIKQLIPLGPLNSSIFAQAVEGVTARGYTPMASALTKAAQALPRVGPASIVLVSDGIETCAPPSTCEVAQQLKAGNRDLIVHTVGFKVDAAARAELSCVAQATGGTYRGAKNGASLEAVLQGQVDAGMRPYVVAGRPVAGTPSPPHAPLLALGQSTDSLPAGARATRYYSVELTGGLTTQIATTVVPPALRGGGTDAKLSVVAQLQDQHGHRCLSTQRENDTLLAGKVDPVTTVIAGVVGGPKWSKQCGDHGIFVLAVTRDSPSTVPTRNEIIVQVERPVSGSYPPVATIPAGVAAPVRQTTRPTTGGASFNTAARVTSGTYRDTLSTGETRYYKVHLDWGQRFAYQVVVDRIGGVDHGAGYVSTAVATPLRQELTLSPTSNAARGFGGPTSVAVTGSTLVPVQYGNRTSENSAIRGYGVAGDYYLSVGMSYPVDDAPYRTGMSVSIQVVGTAQPGPRYASATAPASTRPPTTAGASPSVVNASPSSAPTSSSPASESVDGAAGSPASTIPNGQSAARPLNSSDHPSGWLTVFIAVIIVAALSGGGVAIARRRAHTNRNS